MNREERVQQYQNQSRIACEDICYQYQDVRQKEDILYLSQEAADRL